MGKNEICRGAIGSNADKVAIFYILGFQISEARIQPVHHSPPLTSDKGGIRLHVDGKRRMLAYDRGRKPNHLSVGGEHEVEVLAKGNRVDKTEEEASSNAHGNLFSGSFEGNF